MIWTAKDLRADPVTFLLRNDRGDVLTSIRWDRNAKGFGAYVGERGICEPRFDRAQEAALATVLDQLAQDEIPERFRKGKRADSRRPDAAVPDADQSELGF